MEQEAVEQQAETTAPIESAPIETPTEDTSSEQSEQSADTSVEPKKVSESVPYERFKEVNDRLKQLEQMVQPVQPQVEETEASDNPFDETTTQGVLILAEQRANAVWERKETEKWVKEHADDLKDRVVDSLTKELIRQGYDRDTALAEAKKERESIASSVKKEALAEGVQEGQQLAQKKNEMGAIGTSGTNSKVDPDSLSASEYAAYYGIPRVE